jgi:chromosome partitioning protein
VINQKGGVGKTVITLNLGAALAEIGYRVLLVDLDPQGHLTEAASLDEATAPATLANAMLGKWDGNPVQLVTAYRDRLDVIPTNVDAFLLERALYQERAQEHRLMRVLELVAEPYDVCLIDCPPSLGVLTDNALVYAGQALVPVQSEDSTLRALRLLLDQIRSLEAGLRISVDVVGLVVNLFDKRRGRIVTSTLETLQGMALPILAVIEDRAAVREAWRAGVPVIEYASESEAAQTFRGLAKSLTATGAGDEPGAQQ